MEQAQLFRNTPERGQPCRVPGSGLGECRFYREHIGMTGTVSWLVVDTTCHQYHGFKPEKVRLLKPRRKGVRP
jgi:hypothetical protein